MVAKEKYLLDTDILIAMLRDRGDRTGLRSKALKAGLENCFVSAVSLAELYGGAYRMQSERGLHETEFVKTIFNVIPFGGKDNDESEVFGKNKTVLSSSGPTPDDMDLMIGSTAVAGGYTMVTHNVRHYSRIPKIKIEDWLSGN